MPTFICEDCGYEARDKHGMERHMKRKYPCNSIGIASRDTLKIKKITEVKEEDLKETQPIKIKFKMKPSINNDEKLVKE